VSQAQGTIILAETVIGPVLLLAVLFGALAIGRRVAAPLERAQARQLAFTADASHELRTPLSVIEAQSTLALTQDRDPAWYRAAFERVTAESMRMRRLVESMLWLARFDAQAARPRDEAVDLGVLARQAVDRFEAVAASRQVAIRASVPAGGVSIAAPAEWVDQLLGVLLDNACRYAPAGGHVDVRVAAQAGRAAVTVEDDGPGIPAEERDRIFDRFHRASDKAGGAGLGLAIADAIVRATGGRWSVGRSSSGGASMTVTWPLRGLASSR
jgi:signal transduction histidine kinase